MSQYVDRHLSLPETCVFSGSNNQLSLSYYICFRKVLAHWFFSAFDVGVDVCWVGIHDFGVVTCMLGLGSGLSQFSLSLSSLAALFVVWVE